MFSNRLPSTASLRAFESAARHLTCTGAADELCLSQSAVSKQLRGLEGSLGVELFGRTTQGLELTDAGRKYLDTARGVLSTLEAATSKLSTAHDGAQVISLKVLQTLGERWLVPRLGSFLSANPDIEIQFAFGSEVNDGADAEFRFGSGNWSGHVAQYLFGRELALVCAPHLLDPGSNSIGAQRLAKLKRLQHFQVGEHWIDFDRLHPIGFDVTRRQPIRYGYYSLIIQSAAAGLGVALVPKALVRDDIGRHTLVEVAGYGFQSRLGYHLVTHGTGTEMTGVSRFRQWLVDQASGE